MGGKFDVGESPEECIIREVEEESGLLIKNPTMKGIMSFPNTSDNKGRMVFVFEATEFEGTIRENDEGTLEWISDEELSNLKMPGVDQDYLMKRLKKGDFFSAKFVYNKGKGEMGAILEHKVVFYT